MKSFRAVVRSPRVRRGATRATAVVVASSLLATAIGAGSATAATDPGTGPITTTIGETLVVTTDQKGQNTPFNLVLINGQVYGEGSAQVSLNLGEHGEKTYDLTNSANEVQNFLNISGSYNGEMPLTIETEVKLNGESIDPDSAYNMTGDVEVTYKMTNNTARTQPVSYKGPNGQTVTKDMVVPVPIGNSFTATFADGWFVTDPGDMTATTTAGGTQMSTTAILFPLIPNVVGGVTQTYTIKAHADNASLPGTKSTAIALNLNQLLEENVGDLGSILQNDVVSPIEEFVGSTIGDIYGAANLITGYTSTFSSLNREFIDPLVAELSSVRVNPAVLTARLNALETGLLDLGNLLQNNQVAANEVAAMLNGVATALGTDLPQLIDYLETVVRDLGAPARQASKALTELNQIMSQLDPVALDEYANGSDMQNWCNAVGSTSEFYGFKGITFNIPPYSNSAGYGALASAISASSGANKTALQSLQTALNNQSTGTLAPYDGYMTATQYTGVAKTTISALLQSEAGLPAAEANAIAADIVQTMATAGCKTSTTLINDVVLPVGVAWSAIAPAIPGIVNVLNDISDLSRNPVFYLAMQALTKILGSLSKIASNTGCTDAEILGPLESAIRKYGINNVADHIGEIAAEILPNCGLAQVVQFLGNVDALLGDALVTFGGVVGDLKADVPEITKAANGISEASTVVGNVFDAIPGLGAKVGGLITGVGNDVDSAASGIMGKLESYSSELFAMVNAMSARTVAGDGAPYGNAVGPNTTTMSTYQITQEPARPYGSTWGILAGLAVLFLIVAAGIGTFLHRRRNRQVFEFVSGSITEEPRQ